MYQGIQSTCDVEISAPICYMSKKTKPIDEKQESISREHGNKTQLAEQKEVIMEKETSGIA